MLWVSVQFHSITGSEYPKEQESSCNKHRRYHSKDSTSDAYAMDLTSCKDDRAAGWLTEAHDQDAEQVCWKQKISKKSNSPICLYKRSLLAS